MTSYAIVREIISSRIKTGQWPPGHRLPSASALAEEFGVSVSTINKVMVSLTEAHLIVGKPGLARFVAGTSEANGDDSPVDTGSEGS